MKKNVRTVPEHEAEDLTSAIIDQSSDSLRAVVQLALAMDPNIHHILRAGIMMGWNACTEVEGKAQDILDRQKKKKETKAKGPWN